MIECVGVEDHSGGIARQAPLDRAVEQPRPDPPADEIGREAEEDDLIVLEFEIADQRAVVAGDVKLVAGGSSSVVSVVVGRSRRRWYQSHGRPTRS